MLISKNEYMQTRVELKRTATPPQQEEQQQQSTAQKQQTPTPTPTPTTSSGQFEQPQQLLQQAHQQACRTVKRWDGGCGGGGCCCCCCCSIRGIFVCLFRFLISCIYFFGSCVSLFLSGTPLIPFRLQCGGGGCSSVIIKRLAVILRFAD